MPLLGIKTIAGISVKIKKLRQAGFVETKIVRTKQTGTKTLMYLRLTPKTRLLDFTTKEEAEKLQLTVPSTTVDSSRQLQLTNNNTIEDNNTNDNIVPPVVSEEPFDFKVYLQGTLDNSKHKNNARYFSAYYVKRKGLVYRDKRSFEATVRQWLWAGKILGEFVGDIKKVEEAFRRAENKELYGKRVDWDLKDVVNEIRKI